MKSLKKAFTNIRRTPYQALAAILVLTVTFFVSIMIALLSVSLYQALHYFETRPQLLIFFKTTAPQENITDLKNALDKYPGVVGVKYISQEEALKIYRDLNKKDPLLLELVTASILPSSLEVSTNTLDTLKQLQTQASLSPGVDEVVLRTDVVDTLHRWLTGLKIAGLAFTTILSLTSILIIVIVVGMKISGRDYEIKILQLIGATPWYIKGPFLLEGAIYGLVSAFIAFFLSGILLLYSTPAILSFAGEVPLMPTSLPVILAIYFTSLLSGLMIGTLGSWLAVKRYTR